MTGWVALLLLLTLAPGALAEDPKARARGHFRLGTVYFDAGNYDLAIAEYNQAYALLPLPDFLFNLGQAYRLKGERRAAVDYYRRYLLERPDGEVADEARGHVVQLTLEQNTADQQQRQAEEAARATAAARLPSPSPEPLQVAPLTTAPVTTPVYRRWWLWTAVGVVLVGAAVGLGVGLGSSASAPAPPATTFGTARPFP